MTPAELSEIKQRAEKATKGPWRWEVSLKSKYVTLSGGRPCFDKTVIGFDRWGMWGAAPVFGVKGILTRVDELTAIVPGREHHADWFRNVSHPDADLIANAPTDIANLLAHISELTGKTRELKAENKKLIEKVGQLEMAAKAVIISSYDAVSNQYVVNNREAFEKLQELVREEIPK